MQPQFSAAEPNDAPAARTLRQRVTGGQVTWAEVEPGFHVASRAGEYLGCIDAVRGGFVTRDGHGVPIGKFSSLAEAKASVRQVFGGADDLRQRRTEHYAFVAATAAGVIALALALTAGALGPMST